jgi:DNA-binding MarR family transcriptional regulator
MLTDKGREAVQIIREQNAALGREALAKVSNRSVSAALKSLRPIRAALAKISE